MPEKESPLPIRKSTKWAKTQVQKQPCIEACQKREKNNQPDEESIISGTPLDHKGIRSFPLQAKRAWLSLDNLKMLVRKRQPPVLEGWMGIFELQNGNAADW